MKLKDTATAFARAVGIYKSPASSSDDIAAEIEALEAGGPARKAAIAEAETARREAVLSGNEAATSKAVAALQAAREKDEHAAIILDGLRQRLDEARQAETIAAAQARHDAAKRDRDALAKELPATLRRMSDEAFALIARVETVQEAIQIANADLPPGAAPLMDPYAEVCGTAGKPEAIISQKQVMEWCHAGTWRRVKPDQVKHISVIPGDPNRGTLSMPSHGLVSRGFDDPVERRPFRHVRFMPSVQHDWPDPIREALRIPAVVSRPSLPRREQEERWEPIHDAAADAA